MSVTFDEYQEEIDASVEIEFVELEQSPDAPSERVTPLVGLVARSRDGSALAVRVGFTGEGAYVEVSKRTIDTCSETPVAVMPLPDGGIVAT